MLINNIGSLNKRRLSSVWSTGGVHGLLTARYTPAATVIICLSKCCRDQASKKKTDTGSSPQDVVAMTAKRKWDQVVMFMFLCALFPFLHALLGIGGESEQHVNRPTKATGGPPNKSQRNDTGKAALHSNQLLASETHAGYPVENSEHIAHLTRVPMALAPQDAFPDPTSPVTRSYIASKVRSTPAFAQTPELATPVWFQRDEWDNMLYDPFYLEFNGMPWSTPTKAI
ncbi:uncharacterized protein EDB93DRAFT_1129029 [Suillus bovinus]|uniref:uncharacterized protein n=1 Tax=Suillus bovinus TaxID=48563 RepID=UPI001B85E307|nr:uncharacterized protein EDB93DRAFT_1129029 [Suillus bovinus]KAG2155954.1 hypothetical protein EDB93DRAFT_1129029 [Suillus bovinus]